MESIIKRQEERNYKKKDQAMQAKGKFMLSLRRGNWQVLYE